MASNVGRSLIPWVACLWGIVIGAGNCLSQDKVTFQPENATSVVSMVGQVVEYTGDTLVLLPPNNVPQRIPASTIVSIETHYTPDHLAGLEAFRQGATDVAQTRLIAALKAEHRDWVDQEILSWLVRCAQRQGNLSQAIEWFRQIIGLDSLSRHWDVAPLVWVPASVGADLSARARQWLIGTSRSDQLIAASLLLMDPTYQSAAKRALDDLARDVNPRISRLGKCQLWRLQLETGNVSKIALESWKSDVNRMPRELRNGPQYLIAKGYAGRQEWRQAAAEFLWVPLVYSQNDLLNARSMLEAAEALEQTGLTNEAVLLYRELRQRFDWSIEAGVASDRLKSHAEK